MEKRFDMARWTVLGSARFQLLVLSLKLVSVLGQYQIRATFSINVQKSVKNSDKLLFAIHLSSAM